MTPNIASPIFNLLTVAFFVVVLLGVVLGAYAATQLKKAEGDAPKVAEAEE